MCEKIIDKLYVPSRHGVKPRTYRRLARKKFLATAKKKTKSSQEIYKANGQQLRFLRRNLAHIDRLLETCSQCRLSPKELGYLRVIHTVYEQQRTLFKTRSRRIDNRIVNLHQPHVRPIVRGKERSRVEFGSKLQVSLVEGFMFIDKIGWEAYNEGQHLKSSVAQYKARWGYYPECVYADRIYCTRENRRWLAEQGIKLSAKPLGRPSRSAVAHRLRPARPQSH